MRRKGLILFFVIFVVLVCVLILYIVRSENDNSNGLNSRQALLDIEYSLGDLRDLADVSVSLDGESVDPLSKPSIQPGEHKLIVSKPGFAPLNTSFSSGGRPVKIHAYLVPQQTPTIDSLESINGLSVSPNLGARLSTINYHYNNTWAVVLIESSVTDPSLVVANYNSSLGQWELVIGPGTAFRFESTLLLPETIRRFLVAEDYIGEDF